MARKPASKVPLTGAEVVAALRAEGRPQLLLMSRGKDAIACWLALREAGVPVAPLHLDLVPGLSFVEDSIARLEAYFGERIRRLPHPRLYEMLAMGTFQPPERAGLLDDLGLHTFEEAQGAILAAEGLAPDTWRVSGVRAADSPLRRRTFDLHGSMRRGTSTAYPVWDALKADLLASFRRHRPPLPEDYRLFGRSFDGVDARFLAPLRRHRPEDYRRVLEWFPLADADLRRWELARG